MAIIDKRNLNFPFPITDVANSSGNYEANLNKNKAFNLTLDGNFTLSVSNPTPGWTYVFFFRLLNTGITISLPSSFKFNDPAEVIDTSIPNNRGILTAYYPIEGENFYCSIKQEYPN